MFAYRLKPNQVTRPLAHPVKRPDRTSRADLRALDFQP